MGKSIATQNRAYDMGQTSSQLSPAQLDPAVSDTPRKSQDKAPRLKRSKMSVQSEEPVDPEQESAHALLKMAEGAIVHSKAPPNSDDIAASIQLIAESSPRRQGPSFTPDMLAKASHDPEIRDTRRKKGGKKRRRDKSGASYEEVDIDNVEEATQGLAMPLRREDVSNPANHRFSQSQITMQTLDDIPTDDEEVASYMQEYGREGTGTEAPQSPHYDAFSFSQQPPEAIEALEPESPQLPMYSNYQMPTNVYTSPKNRRGKKRRESALDSRVEEQSQQVDGKGQHSQQFDFEAFDDFCNISTDWANLLGNSQGYDMPIDPELHSMIALPPSADLSNLDIEVGNAAQRKKPKTKSRVDASRSAKRQRVNEVQDEEDMLYNSPYSNGCEQIVEGPVVSGLEDLQQRISPELGSPFMEDVVHDSRENPGTTPPRKKKRASTSAKTQQDEPEAKNTGPSKKNGGKGGPFTSNEISKLERFRDGYCEANKMGVWQFNDLVQSNMRGNPQAIPIFNDLYDLFPYRTRQSTQKICRRRFHNFSIRGKWTHEEDEALKHAVVEKGTAWKAVGEMIERFPEDCRDRYRNYLVNSEHRMREQWTEAEVVNLCTAILECQELMRDERRRTKEAKYGPHAPESDTDSDQDREDLKTLNWQTVSDRMGEYGGGRSRLQCSFKWGKLKERERNKYLKEINEARKGMRALENGTYTTKTGPSHNAWRQKRAWKKVNNMRPGDINDLLMALWACNAPVEGNIPWMALGEDEFQRRWSTTERKAAWNMLKQEVPNSEEMHYHDIMNDLASRLPAHDPEKMAERWDPEVHGYVSESDIMKPKIPIEGPKKQKTSKKREAAGTKKREKELRLGIKSAEFVHSSDEDDAETGEREQEQDVTPVMKNGEPSGANGAISRANEEEVPNPDEEIEAAGSEVSGSLFNALSGGEENSAAENEVSPELANRMQLLRNI